MRAVSPPRQIERENEMIVISYRLFVWCNAGLPCAAGMAKRIIKKKRSEWEIRTRLVSPAFPMGKAREGIPHDPAYLPGSHSPQLTCFPLANFFEILYNRIDMIVTGDW